MKVSVITVNYNNATGLEKTIKSVISQSYRDFEYIVIDGGSTDGSREILESFSDQITYWVSEPDKGIYNAMNKGIRQAKGEYLHFLNSGDMYAGEDVLNRAFSGKKYNAHILRGMQTPHTYRWDNFGDRNVTLYDLYVDALRHQATFIKRQLFDKYGLYDENYKIVSDWKFFLKAIIAGEPTAFLNFDVMVFDMNGISSNPANQDAMYKERESVLEELLPEAIRYDYNRLIRQDKQTKEDAPYYYIIDFVKRNRFPYFCIRVLNKIYKTFKS
ncbi:MAG: glycosyltransferase [Prevotella sp.]|jgi:glycosyltransferase involved in cell wall biosynthesis|nr:glycosyltransferase [Prevotella sp.]